MRSFGIKLAVEGAMDIRNDVVVITGASSGLGRETAIQFARRGATVVVAARRGDALEETARMCRNAGGSASCVVTDVTVEEQVHRLAQVAIERFGRIDVWVNNAGVTLFAPLEGTPFEDIQRVIETNLFGSMYGARAVLPIFRRQRRGVLINVGSLLSKIAQPFVPAYVISKFGVRGLSEALRSELAGLPDVHVCTVYPYAVNTQHFESGANLLGLRPRAMPPDQPPERVARAIVGLAKHPRRERNVPRISVLALMAHFVFPATVERIVFEALRGWHFDERFQAPTEGNLFEPARDEPRVTGHSPPRASTPRVLVWLVKRFLKLGSDRNARVDAPALPRPVAAEGAR